MKVLSVDGLSKLITLMKEEFASSSSLSTVATSGSYNDLSNKPTIPVVDQTYNASSANAQSGVAIASAGFLTNNTSYSGSLALLGQFLGSSSSKGIAIGDGATAGKANVGTNNPVAIGTNSTSIAESVAIGGGATAQTGSIAIGYDSKANNDSSTSIGDASVVNSNESIAIGFLSKVNANSKYGVSIGPRTQSSAYGAIQIGGYNATNSEAGTLYVGLTASGTTTNNYKLLGSDGKIPDDRLNTTIARTSQIPSVDQTYDGTSTNAQSGVAINGAGFLKNTATGGDLAILGSTSSSQSIAIGTSCSVTGAWSLGIGYHAQATGTSVALGWYAKAGDSTKNNSGCIAIGRVTEATGNQSVAVGLESEASGNYSISLGTAAHARANYAYAIGYGAVNSQEKSLMFGFGDNSYILLDGTTGLIPDARISTNIARTSQIPSASDLLPSQTGNSGKFLTTNGTTASWGNVTIPFGESTSAADAVQKEVTISEITELKTGQIIIVKPTITSTVANATLKLNNFTAYPMLYGAAAITTSTDSITWAANYPSWFRFDGSNWVFLGHGVDNNTTYSAMSVAEGTTGTKTTARSVRADYLKQIIQGTKLTGLSTSTNSAVAATDTILVAIGKLQAQIGDIESAINTIRGV